MSKRFYARVAQILTEIILIEFVEGLTLDLLAWFAANVQVTLAHALLGVNLHRPDIVISHTNLDDW